MVTSVCTSTQCPVNVLHERLISPPTLDSLSLYHSCLFPSLLTAAAVQLMFPPFLSALNSAPREPCNGAPHLKAPQQLPILTLCILSGSLATWSLPSHPCKPLWILSGSPEAWLLLALMLSSSVPHARYDLKTFENIP